MSNVQKIHDKLVDILNHLDLYNENSTLEFKVEPHNKTNWCEFLKDILGLLNSTERTENDSFMIYGISNDKYMKGINKELLYDEAKYQQIFEKITPTPQIELLIVEGKELNSTVDDNLTFASFYIPVRRDNTVYEIGKECSNCSNKNRQKSTRVLHKGCSFIRQGSSTRELLESDRQKIRSLNTLSSYLEGALSDVRTAYDNEGLSIVALALFLGGWDESCKFDLELIEDLSGLSYEKWISTLRILRSRTQNSVFKNIGSTWAVNDYDLLLNCTNGEFSLTVMSRLLKIVKEKLTWYSSMTKSEFTFENMDLNISLGKLYSNMIISGLMRFLALYGIRKDLFKDCPVYKRTTQINEFISIIFDRDNYRVYTIFSDGLPFLAQASSNMYLQCVRNIFELNDNFKNILIDGQKSYFLYDPIRDIVNGIRIAAVKEECFSEAMKLLIDLSAYCEYAFKSAVSVLLPWYPQTLASVGSRKGIAEYLLKIDSITSWKILVQLLPFVQSDTLPVCSLDGLKGEYSFSRINGNEYKEISTSYCINAIRGTNCHPERFINLLENIDAFAYVDKVKELVETIDNKIDDLSEETYLQIWNEVEKITKRIEKNKYIVVQFEEHQINYISNLLKKLESEDQVLLAKKNFMKSEFEFDIDVDYKKKHAEILKKRIDLIDKVFEQKGFSIIEEILTIAKSPREFAEACAEAKCAEKILINITRRINKDNKFFEFYRSFLFNYFYIKEDRQEDCWICQFPLDEWNNDQTIEFFSALPCVPKVWKRIERMNQNIQRLYWEKTQVLYRELEKKDIDTILVKKINTGCFDCAIRVAGGAIEDDIKLDTENLLILLETYPDNSEKNSFNDYFIKVILNYLESQIPCDRLYEVEIKYINRIDYDEISDLYINQYLLDHPKKYVELLISAYRLNNYKKNDNEQTRSSERSLRILQNCKVIPGLKKDNSFVYSDFEIWINDALSEVEDENIINILEEEIGKGLFHVPQDVDGFFIYRSVAEYLDNHQRACIGYFMESINSRGIHFTDLTGEDEFKLSSEYSEKAQNAEEAGFLNFAVTLRNISSDFKTEGYRSQSLFNEIQN